MKLKYLKNLLMVAAVAFFAACDPIVEEEHLKNNTTVEGVELIATQNAQGGNTIELKMNTPGIVGYWDYNLDRAFSDRIEFVYPIPGTSTFTFTGTLGSEFFTKSIDVTVNVLDTRLDQDWYDLVSEDTNTGKTWVYNGTPGNGMFWYMSPPGDPAGWGTAWWNAGDCCCPDSNGKMVFDLNGAANYTYYSDEGADPQYGSFKLDVKNQKLQTIGAPLMGGNRDGGAGNSDGIYQIISLTEDELILYVSGSEVHGTGWTWVFKPAE